MKFTTGQKFCIAKEGGNIYNFTQVQLQTPVEKNEITTFGTSINITSGFYRYLIVYFCR